MVVLPPQRCMEEQGSKEDAEDGNELHRGINTKTKTAQYRNMVFWGADVSEFCPMFTLC